MIFHPALLKELHSILLKSLKIIISVFQYAFWELLKASTDLLTSFHWITQRIYFILQQKQR